VVKWWIILRKDALNRLRVIAPEPIFPLGHAQALTLFPFPWLEKIFANARDHEYVHPHAVPLDPFVMGFDFHPFQVAQRGLRFAATAQ
jgi:hypothetical protein